MKMHDNGIFMAKQLQASQALVHAHLGVNNELGMQLLKHATQMSVHSIRS